MRQSLLDTSILISFLKGEQNVVTKVEEYLEEFNRFSLSIIEDADILIAASCLVKDMVLVTDNEEHFRRIESLGVENWLMR